MFNWRKPVLSLYYRGAGRDVVENLREIHALSERSPAEVTSRQRVELESLLSYAAENVPYYEQTLADAGVVTSDGVQLERFERVPLLTKERIKANRPALRNPDPPAETYVNTSGGTTGEPVEFVQDTHYLDWNLANKHYFKEVAGKELGEPEVKLWGNEDDIIEDEVDVTSRVANWLHNRTELNSFQMSEANMRRYVNRINERRPAVIWSYVESIYRLAEYIDEEGLAVHGPDGIVSTAGTLEPQVRETVERVFDTTVHNQYGSREVGDIAFECPRQEGLHLFTHTHYVEIVDDDGRPAQPGERGRIVVTSLTNLSMPLIRYDIGDTGVKASEDCSCDLPFPVINDVTGRVSDHFVAPSGEVVHGEFFTHLFYHRPWVDTFQVRQVARDDVVVRAVVRDGAERDSDDVTEIRNKIREAMGDDVAVTFEFPEHIPRSSSGKYRYTISELRE